MGGSVGSMVLVLLSGVALIWYLLDYFYAPEHAPDEPPVVSQTFPYIGHIIGLFRHGLGYYEMTSARCKSPIYTLNMLNGKVYVVISPDLINAVSRNSKSLAFNPFIAQIGRRLTAVDDLTVSIINNNLNGEQGHWGYVIEIHDRTLTAMLPGKDLDQMNNTMVKEAMKHLQSLDHMCSYGLFAWIKHLVTACSTKAVYGNNNPLDVQPDLENAFWDFDKDLNLLLLNILPNFIAPKGSKGREKIAIAFQQYFANDPRGRCSAIIKARYEIASKYGMTTLNMGRLEVGTLIGILANNIPSTFWMLVHVFSDGSLLKDLRSELEKSVTTIYDEATGEPVQQLDVSSLKEGCPLLVSTLQEVLRVHSRGATARVVLEDTMLNDQYFLQKGSVVQIPNSVIHSDVSTWGPDAKVFQPRRFLKQEAKGKEPKMNAASYRPFGGGSNLCPGRHFASHAILSINAMMILRYNISPTNGDWDIPKPKQRSLATAVFEPQTDIKVKIAPRDGSEYTRWTVTMS